MVALSLAQERAHRANHTPLPGLRVLIADGHADAAESLLLVLSLWGCEVRLARTGRDAGALAVSFQPDVLLSDLILPELDGLQLAAGLRSQERLGRILLIAVTCLSDAAWREKSRAAGFAYHLVKPLDLDALHAILEQHAPTVPTFTR